MALTEEQLAQLSARRKLNPPTFYNAATGATYTITSDTEDALILASPEEKRKAVEYLRLILDSVGGSTDYDDALEKFTTKQAEVHKAHSDALQTITASFDSFKDGLISGGGEPAYVVGFSPLISAMIKGLGGIKQESDAAEFHNRGAEVAKAFYGGRLTAEDQRELRSWIRVLLSYP